MGEVGGLGTFWKQKGEQYNIRQVVIMLCLKVVYSSVLAFQTMQYYIATLDNPSKKCNLAKFKYIVLDVLKRTFSSLSNSSVSF